MNSRIRKETFNCNFSEFAKSFSSNDPNFQINCELKVFNKYTLVNAEIKPKNNRLTYYEKGFLHSVTINDQTPSNIVQKAILYCFSQIVRQFIDAQIGENRKMSIDYSVKDFSIDRIKRTSIINAKIRTTVS